MVGGFALLTYQKHQAVNTQQSFAILGFLVGKMFFIIVGSDEDLCDSGGSGGSPFLVGRQRSLISTAGRPTLYPKQCHWIMI